MQEPFSILPLESISDRICKDVFATINKQHLMKRSSLGFGGAERNAQLFPYCRGRIAGATQDDLTIPADRPSRVHRTSLGGSFRGRMTRDLLASPLRESIEEERGSRVSVSYGFESLAI